MAENNIRTQYEEIGIEKKWAEKYTNIYLYIYTRVHNIKIVVSTNKQMEQDDGKTPHSLPIQQSSYPRENIIEVKISNVPFPCPSWTYIIIIIMTKT